MEMCYDGALVMPSNYAVMNEEEMTYVEGGITTLQKVGICSAIVVAGVALTAALLAGHMFIAAKILKISVGMFIKKLGVVGVSTVVAGTMGISFATVSKAIGYVVRL